MYIKVTHPVYYQDVHGVGRGQGGRAEFAEAPRRTGSRQDRLPEQRLHEGYQGKLLHNKRNMLLYLVTTIVTNRTIYVLVYHFMIWMYEYVLGV